MNIKFRKYLWFIRTIFLGLFLYKLGNRSYIAPRYYIIGFNKILIGNKVRISFDFRAEAHGPGKIYINDNK